MLCLFLNQVLADTVELNVLETENDAQTDVTLHGKNIAHFKLGEYCITHRLCVCHEEDNIVFCFFSPLFLHLLMSSLLRVDCNFLSYH